MKKYYAMLLTCLLFDLSRVTCFDQFVQTSQESPAVEAVSVYLKMFHDTVVKTETFLHNVEEIKQYWLKELFQESLPWSRKNPTYWLHKNSYVKLLRKRIALLQNVENQVATLLGIALAGQYQLSKIDENNECKQKLLQQAAAPFYDYFHIDCGDFVSEQKLVQDEQNFMNLLHSQIEKLETIVAPHRKPHHIIEHRVAYACAVAASIATIVLYQKYKDQILDLPILMKKTFMIKEIEQLFDFKKCKNGITHNWLTGWLGIAQDIDTVPETLNSGAEEFRNFINQFVPLINLGIVFGAYRCCDTIYDRYVRYVRYDWRYKPMKNIVRSIDRLLITIDAGCQRSFCDDGKLHVLILQLKSYMYCLTTHELALFQQDITALLSFDLTYAQKQAVIGSMYKTYGFLK